MEKKKSNTMKGITFNILHSTDESRSLLEMGLTYPLSDLETRPMTFYVINAIGLHIDKEDEDRPYCDIHTNDSCYLVADKTYEEVKQLLAEFN